MVVSRGQVRRIVSGLGLMLLIGVLLVPTAAAGAKTKRVSVATGGTEGNGASDNGATSPNGRYTVFDSLAANLVANDDNSVKDVFLRDHKRKRTKRVSLATGARQLDGASARPTVSADGRFVAFESDAVFLNQTDINGGPDIFVYDRKKKRLRRISVSSSGVGADGISRLPVISDDGRFVAFFSHATNLVPSDDNGEGDVFIHDRKKKRTKRVSIGNSGKELAKGGGNFDMSGDGRFIAFVSAQDGIAKGDANGNKDIFIRDRKKRTTRLISKSSRGKVGNNDSSNPDISRSGRFVAFSSGSSNFARIDSNDRFDVFVRDRKKGKTRRVSISSSGGEGNGHSWSGGVSADGRFVIFDSTASNLIPNDNNGDTDVLVRDRKKGKTKRVSVRSDGGPGEGVRSRISDDGRFVVFTSEHPNMVPFDSNLDDDVFRRGPLR